MLQRTEILKPVDDAKLVPRDIAVRVAGSRVVGLRGKELIELHAGMHIRFVVEQIIYKVEILIAAAYSHLGAQVEFFGFNFCFFELVKSLLKTDSIEAGRPDLLFGVIEQICFVAAFEYPVNLVARVWKSEAIAGVIEGLDAGTHA